MSVIFTVIHWHVTGYLDVQAAVPQYVWRNPNDPQRHSNHQYH
ncbi:hypothetical protein [Arthrobacter sp. MMS24-S77]